MSDVSRPPDGGDPDRPEGIRYDPDLAVHEPAEVPADPLVPSRRRPPILTFAGGILLLVGAVYVLFGLIAHEGKSSEDYLQELRLRGGGAWQVAFELSRHIPREDPAKRGPRVVTDIIRRFEEARSEDPRLRRYLALALGELRDARAAPALRAALSDTDLQTRIYAAWGLGAVGDGEAVPHLMPLLESEEAALRKMAAYALGTLPAPAGADDQILAALRPLLNDPVEDVAWNAALSLARRGDGSGMPLIGRLLDRSYLASVERAGEEGPPRRLDAAQQEEAMINAIKAIVILRDPTHLARLRALAAGDPSLRVRQEALAAIAAIE